MTLAAKLLLYAGACAVVGFIAAVLKGLMDMFPEDK